MWRERGDARGDECPLVLAGKGGEYVLVASTGEQQRGRPVAPLPRTPGVCVMCTEQ